MTELHPSHLSSIWRLLRDPQTGWVPKIIAVVTAVYIIMPLDIIPDFIPFAGWIDDVVLTGLAFWYLNKIARKYRQ